MTREQFLKQRDAITGSRANSIVLKIALFYIFHEVHDSNLNRPQSPEESYLYDILLEAIKEKHGKNKKRV